jgi:cytochrome c-type biogenesis protein
VFVSSGALFGFFGSTLQEHKDVLSKVLGAFMILMGLFFMGLMPWLTQREFRLHKRPVAGLVSAPVLGALFGIGWTPCIGPTLSSVLMLSSDQGSAGRGALLTVAYCLGLGVPFVLAAVAFRKALGAFGWVKRHYQWVMRIGGGMMIATGLLLLTGVWDGIVQQMQSWSDGFTVGI